jgi:S-adenosylhomocysteine hydrolase
MLPLLTCLQSLLPTAKELDGWSCIYVQHILRSNCDCAEFLIGRGLDKSKLRIFGKAYSTSELALAYYLEHGFNAQSIGAGYDYGAPFDDALISTIKNALEAMVANGEKRILLIDEGGLALQAAATFTQADVRLAVVELTARGTHHYHLLEHRAPIVDVARSDAKKRIEAPLIAKSMALLLGTRIRATTEKSLSSMRVGLVGAGAIGGALCDELQSIGAAFIKFDAVEQRSTAKTITDALVGADIVTSSTGRGMDWSELVESLPDGTILANCGSSDIEFRPWRLRAHFDAPGAFNIEVPGSPWRGNITIAANGRKLTLLGGGFPVNFDGTPDPIPAREIQLTRTILMAGAIQAATSQKPGISELDTTLQSQLVNRFNELLLQ